MLPWVSQVVTDMRGLWYYHAWKLNSLPDPADDPHAWHEIMLNYKREWSELVATYTFFESPIGNQDKIAGASTVARWRCQFYPLDSARAFTSNKKLLAHQRIKHGCRNAVGQYVDGTGRCPCCRVQFSHRARVIAHLSETRCRAKVRYVTCRDRMLAGEFPRVDQQGLETDKLKQREAYRASHSHVLVDRPAQRSRWANQSACGHTRERPSTLNIAQEDLQFRPAHRITGKRPTRSINWTPAEAKRPHLH